MYASDPKGGSVIWDATRARLLDRRREKNDERRERACQGSLVASSIRRNWGQDEDIRIPSRLRRNADKAATLVHRRLMQMEDPKRDVKD